jgi:DNA-binding transcriptional LysR family regulator
MIRPSISELAAFMAVATHRSFRKAADEVGSAPSTLSHTIRALEESMGVRLLNRTTRSVSEAGFRLISLLGPALDSLNDAVDSVAAFRLNVAGTVRINAPRLAAVILVRDVLPIMADRFPEVTVDIVVEGQLVDIVSDGFDAGVRLIGSIPKDMITVSLVKAMRFVCLASPDYLERAGVPKTPEDLKHHRFIAHRLPSGKLYRWEFERAGQELVIDASGPVILDDHDLMVEAAAKGLGIAYVGSLASENAVAKGQVREILSEWMPAAEGMALYYPGHRAVPPALRAFLDTVKDAVKMR